AVTRGPSLSTMKLLAKSETGVPSVLSIAPWTMVTLWGPSLATNQPDGSAASSIMPGCDPKTDKSFQVPSGYISTASSSPALLGAPAFQLEYATGSPLVQTNVPS